MTDGSIEDWAGGTPASWRFFDTAGDGSIERLGSSVPTDVQEGMYSAKVTRTADGGDSAFDKDAPGGHMDITGITELKLSFWMRSGTGAPVSVGGQIQPFGGDPLAYMPPSPDVVGPLFATPVPASWKYYETTYTPAAGVSEVSVRFNTVAPNSFVVDDIKLINTATGADIMTNGGLETWGAGVIVGDAVCNDGVPDNWRMFAVTGAGGMIERLEFKPVVNAVHLDWTTMQ